MNKKLKVNNKVAIISCGKKTCRHKSGSCKFLGRWILNKAYESPYCCELLKIQGIMPFPLDCYGRHPYRICHRFEITDSDKVCKEITG